MENTTFHNGFDSAPCTVVTDRCRATFERTGEDRAVLEIEETRRGLAGTIGQPNLLGTLEAVTAIRNEELRQMRESLGRVDELLTGRLPRSRRQMVSMEPTVQCNEERSWGRRGDRFEVDPVVSRSQRTFDGRGVPEDADLVHAEIAGMIASQETSIRVVYHEIMLEVQRVHDGTDDLIGGGSGL